MTAAPDSLAWLDQVPESDHDRIAAILDEYLADAERGLAPAIDDFVARYPEWSAPLRGALQSLQAVNRVVAAFPATHREGPWPQLGDYQIVRELGRGGMGIVYEARQVSLGRTVALKVLPFAAVLEPTHVQRFQNEAQAAAQLHHPHIVPVFAVGCERGVHFYSMQYIDGQSLDQAIRQLRDWRPPVANASGGAGDQPTMPDLGVPPRAVSAEEPVVSVAEASPAPTTKVACGLSTQGSIQRSAYVKSVVELMIQAADALHYAHESGVIHRDIKPSNLLIDRRGKLSVADFGLARCQSLANLTTHGGLCGTVRYMSPEQASGRSALVDLRTDVYGLGITLYELLTLRTPFEGDDREALLRQIQADEPPTPRRFNRAVPADLETIILKAMAKSRDERYESAEALASDLRRFLSGQPTLARRPTVWDRAGKWIARRAKGVAISLAALAVSLVAFGVFSAKLAHEQRRTGTALAEAELHLRAARLAVDDFSADLSEQLAIVPGAEPVRLAALERAERFYLEFERYASDDLRWRQDLAIASVKRAFVLERLGRLDDAEVTYRQALKRLDQSTRSQGLTAEWLAEAAVGRAHAGQFWMRRQRWHEGLEALETAYHDIQTATAISTEDASLRDDLARIEGAFGEALCERGERAQGRRLLESAVATMRRLQGTEREVGERREGSSAPGDRREARLAVLLRRLAEMSRNVDQAARYYEESLELQRRRLARQPEWMPGITELASTLNGYASRIAEEDPQRAAELFGEARRLLEQAVRMSPDDFRLRRDWAVALHNEGMAVESLGDSNRSLGLLDEAIREQTAAYEASGYDPEYQNQLQQYEKHRERIRQIRTRPDGSVWIDRLEGTTI